MGRGKSNPDRGEITFSIFKLNLEMKIKAQRIKTFFLDFLNNVGMNYIVLEFRTMYSTLINALLFDLNVISGAR